VDDEIRRNRPTGSFFDHFMSVGDKRTHLEIINPLNGNSIGYVPGAERGYQSQPLQTFTTNDILITAQFRT
jgi:hypothetical protein